MVPISSGTWAQRRNKTESLSLIVNSDAQKSLSELEQPKIYGGNAILNVLSFFSENSYSFRCFQSDREFIPDPKRSNRESTFAQVKFCFRHNKLWNWWSELPREIWKMQETGQVEWSLKLIR